MNASEQISPETATFERFLEFARPGGQFHPNFCSLIEQSLYNDPFSEEQLQDLAKKGEHGTLVAIVLAFAYGRFPDPEWAIAVLGVKPPGAMQNEPCLRSILSRWENILFAAKADPTWRASYLEKLKVAIKPSQPYLSEVASEMLSIDPSLTPEHLDILLRHLTHVYFDDQQALRRAIQTAGGPQERRIIERRIIVGGERACGVGPSALECRRDAAERRGSVSDVSPLAVANHGSE